MVYRDELVCIVSPEHALAKTRAASIARLGREPFVAHNVPSPLRQKVIAAFQRHKTPLQMEVELPSLEAIKRFVQRGNGVALVPGLTVEGELASGALVAVAVPELQVERKLRLVYRRQAAHSHAARAFLRVVEAHALKDMATRFALSASAGSGWRCGGSCRSFCCGGKGRRPRSR